MEGGMRGRGNGGWNEKRGVRGGGGMIAGMGGGA